MAWKFGALYLKKDHSVNIIELLKKLELTLHSTGELIGMTEATSVRFTQTAIGFHKGLTLIHNNFLPYDCAFESHEFYDFDKILAHLSIDEDILCFFLDGNTSTYGLSLFSKGKRIRSRGTISNTLVFTEGALLAIEKKDKVNDEENRIFNIVSDFIDENFIDLLNNPSILLSVYKQ